MGASKFFIGTWKPCNWYLRLWAQDLKEEGRCWIAPHFLPDWLDPHEDCGTDLSPSGQPVVRAQNEHARALSPLAHKSGRLNGLFPPFPTITVSLPKSIKLAYHTLSTTTHQRNQPSSQHSDR